MLKNLIVTLITLFVVTDLRAGIDPLTELTIDKIIVLDVDATINPAVANYLSSEINRNSVSSTSLFVIKLNTPGGLVSTTKEILTTIGKSQHPVVIWVTPDGASATSAGAIIASSAHGLVMNEGTNIGAATPVGLGEDIKESDGRSKAINDLTALVRSLSEARHRNADAFAGMIKSADSFPADEAFKKGIIDGVVSSLDGIRALYHEKPFTILGKKYLLKFAPIVETEQRPMDTGLQLLNIFAHPTTAYILFILGAALLYFEFQAPGGYIAGSVGVLCLIIAGISFQVLPLNFGAVALLIAGLVMLVLEIYVTSYGLLGLAGFACLAFGSLFLFRTEDGWITVQYSLIFSLLTAVAAFVGVIAWYMARHRSPNAKFFTHESQEAVVMSELSSGLYQVKVKGEIWKARSDLKLAPGQAVTVRRQSDQELLLEIIKS